MYRVRRLMLQVESADVKQVMITCKSRFYIQLPQYLTKDKQQDAIEQALMSCKTRSRFTGHQAFRQSLGK
ncbi:hypothetical protein BMF81_04376 [Nodularia spumigena UHCC 0039]|uniref:Uncharacterized protein n=2 Tax=Nodularia spumigena TaxID=70799 RepID=A0A2S0QB27_NODSP|nr:hypothetical protein [Nodularia spumigena]AHJ28548.1 hypothetical protein NSP_22160 [Nodularia spumigena CCY9414]AVZ31558.1 hypothetical protein BMF81_04376 [Nodularia spumigena UHCC 0039]EAW44635.1 hypothetical protein N9414_06199 [Nodularia spumigena CCY9414]